eukprot:TCONS_00055008-protein
MIDASESNLRKDCQFINGESLDVPGYDTHDGRRVRNNLNDVLPVSTGIKGHDKMSAALLASCIASIASILFGYTMGYTSPTQKDIEKELMSTTQFSWFASLVAIGAIIGSTLGAIMIEKYGRKTTIMLISLVHVPGWCLICYGHSVEILYFGRFLTGIGVGVGSLAVPMYIAEVASARLRGGLGSINQFAITIGILMVYLVGYCLSWRWAAIIPVMLSALMVLLMSLMPESPRWLLANNKRHLALLELSKLRGQFYDSEEECFEIESNLDQQGKISLSDFKEPALYRPFIICSMLMLFQQFTGINAIILYCTKIFDLAGLHYPTVISLAVAATQILFTGIACLVVDKSGRRILLLAGSVVMFLCQFLLGVYFDLIEVDGDDNKISIFGKFSHTFSPHKISILAISCIVIYIAIFSIGWGPLPWLLMSELLPPKAKGLVGGFVTLINWTCVFITTNLFHKMVSTFFAQGTFWFFAGFALLSFLFTLFYVPETKGKTLEEIEEIFAQRSG